MLVNMQNNINKEYKHLQLNLTFILCYPACNIKKVSLISSAINILKECKEPLRPLRQMAHNPEVVSLNPCIGFQRDVDC